MSNKKNLIFIISLLFSLLLPYTTSQEKEDIIVYPRDNNIISYCHDNAFFIKFDVKFSKQLDKIIPFEIELPLPNSLPFKCIIDGPKSNIFCFHSLNNYVWSLALDSRMEIPYSFPYIEGIKWDYDSFLRRIYRHLWRTTENCGLLYTTEMGGGDSQLDKAKMIFDVSQISGGKCSSSKFDYSFNMKLKLTGGEIFDQIKKAQIDKKDYKITYE